MSNDSDNDRRTPRRDAFARALPTNAQRDVRQRTYLLAVYNYMVGGLTLGGLVVFMIHDSGLDQTIARTPLFWPVVLLPLAFVIIVTPVLEAIGEETAQALFWIYAVILGLSFGSFFPLLTGVSIAPAFFVVALSFAAISLYGHFTEADPSTAGAIQLMVLAGLAAASLTGWLNEAAVLLFALSIIGVVVFAGLAAHGMERIKQIHLQSAPQGDPIKGSILAALGLYLDVINLFIVLIQFGRAPHRD